MFKIQIHLSFNLDSTLFIGVFAGVSLRTVSSAARQPRSLSAIATFTAWSSELKAELGKDFTLLEKSQECSTRMAVTLLRSTMHTDMYCTEPSSLELGTISGALQQQRGVNV